MLAKFLTRPLTVRPRKKNTASGVVRNHASAGVDPVSSGATARPAGALWSPDSARAVSAVRDGTSPSPTGCLLVTRTGYALPCSGASLCWTIGFGHGRQHLLLHFLRAAHIGKVEAEVGPVRGADLREKLAYLPGRKSQFAEFGAA